MRLPAFFLVAAAFLASTGCADSSKSLPTSPSGAASSGSSAPATVTERFDAIIDLKGSSFFPFNVSQTGGAVMINLASLSPLNRPGLLAVSMELGYGVPIKDDDGNTMGCDLRRTIQATPALTAQLTDTLTTGSYCANIADVGNMREPANFSIRITHP
jgi:hypothetical protein